MKLRYVSAVALALGLAACAEDRMPTPPPAENDDTNLRPQMDDFPRLPSPILEGPTYLPHHGEYTWKAHDGYENCYTWYRREAGGDWVLQGVPDVPTVVSVYRRTFADTAQKDFELRIRARDYWNGLCTGDPVYRTLSVDVADPFYPLLPPPQISGPGWITALVEGTWYAWLPRPASSLDVRWYIRFPLIPGSDQFQPYVAPDTTEVSYRPNGCDEDFEWKLVITDQYGQSKYDTHYVNVIP